MKQWSVSALVLSSVVLVAPVALAQGDPNYQSRWDHPYMWSWGGWGMIFGPIMMILFIAVIVAVVVLLVRWLGVGAHGSAASPPTGKVPLDILKERFARGEIDKDEFAERKRLLSE